MAVTSLNACKKDAVEGRACGLENPWNSYIWFLKEAIEFLNTEGVFDFGFHSCMRGGDRKKATRVRTVVVEFQQRETWCSSTTNGICGRAQAKHAPWFDAAQSHLFGNSEAEYPWDFCVGAAIIRVFQGVFRRYLGQYLFNETYSGQNAPLT